MSLEDRKFYIRHSGKEYVVMTTKMYGEILLGDSAKAVGFLKELGSKTVVAHDQLYLILSKMVEQYKPETMEIQGAKP